MRMIWSHIIYVIRIFGNILTLVTRDDLNVDLSETYRKSMLMFFFRELPNAFFVFLYVAQEPGWTGAFRRLRARRVRRQAPARRGLM